MATTRTSKQVTVVTAKDLGHSLGLSAADTDEMEFRSELTVVLTKIIQVGGLTHAAIAKRAGTSGISPNQEGNSLISPNLHILEHKALLRHRGK